MKKRQHIGKVTYPKVFWLFMICSVIGVGIEGVWYYFKHGHWETHVVSIWGPFCIIYGIAAVLFYIIGHALHGNNVLVKLAATGAAVTVVELICGFLLKYALNMKAWDYSGYPMNFKGIICVKMSVIWGLAGVVFCLMLPLIDDGLDWLTGNFWEITCLLLTVFMAVNLILTGICLWRWSQRHKEHKPSNSFMKMIDDKYDDDYMSDRFCEWHFLD